MDRMRGKRRKSQARAAWLLAVSLLLAAGCGAPASHAKTGAASTSASASTTGAAATVVVALGPLTNINWYLPLIPIAYNSSANVYASELMYKPLYQFGKTGQPDFAHSIASAIRWNATGTVYTVTLNPKWRWSDGTPVTAQDVRFDFQLLQAAGSSQAPRPWPYAGSGPDSLTSLAKSLKVVSPESFQVTLAAPVNQVWFEVNELSQLVPLPSKAWNKYPASTGRELAYLTGNGNNPAFFKVTDGPFKMVAGVQNSAWTFLPNPAYSGHKPSIGKLVLAYETSDTAEFDALRTGVVQVGYLPASEYAARSQLTNYRFVPKPSSSVARTVLNFKNPQVGSILRQFPVREALQLGMDQQTIINSLYHGLGAYGIGPVPSLSPYLDPALKQPVYPFDLAKGRQVLEAAGWHPGSDGVMTNANGERLSFSLIYPSGGTTSLALVQVLQQDWQKEGFQIQLRALPFATILQYHHQPAKWDIQTGLTVGVGGYPVSATLYETNGSRNFVDYSNPTLDGLIRAALAPQTSPEAAQQALDRYQEFVARHLPNLWGPVGDQFREVERDMHGVISSQLDPNASPALYVQYWRRGA